MFPYLPAIFISLRHSEYFFSLAGLSALATFVHLIWTRSVLVPVMNQEAVAQ
jgi:hypothetical protein